MLTLRRRPRVNSVTGLTTVAAMGEPELPETAGARFELIVEDEGRVGWAKAMLYAFVFYITFGSVELYPKATVRVRDRISGEDVVTQTWSHPRGASEAIAQLQEDLVQLTPDAFLDRWSPAR